ncbi:NUDIX hydrolase [Nonomuraea sp. CA-218870]|uniref:NUDIX hydrolase n=1 Tax=Nonomuraea sp. CA-218870 TaxID=3239998 RepID=UPI003D9137D8
MTTDQVLAAGAVIWRGAEHDPEVALVHRPRYADWTFPKGKLNPGEHVIAAALREVREETGLDVVLGRALPPTRYVDRSRPKRVDYWVGRVAGEHPFVAGDEVDALRWVSLGRARELLTYERDVGLLRALTAAPLATVPLVLVRHGSAGSRQDWRGADSLRPLDAEGRAQAAALATVLPAYRPAVLLSSPSLRCVQTLAPYGADVRLEPLLSEEEQDPRETPALVAALVGPAAVCSHGEVLPALIAGLSGEEVRLRKGALAVLHRVGGRVAGVETYGL